MVHFEQNKKIYYVDTESITCTVRSLLVTYVRPYISKLRVDQTMLFEAHKVGVYGGVLTC